MKRLAALAAVLLALLSAVSAQRTAPDMPEEYYGNVIQQKVAGLPHFPKTDRPTDRVTGIAVQLQRLRREPHLLDDVVQQLLADDDPHRHRRL